jgi:16S rRNA (adenine1518-N6/adenine1519-N6)-dimethyltransferase
VKFKNKRAGFQKPRPDFDLAPNKRLGQHFLRDESVLDGIVAAANAIVAEKNLPKSCVEIGPGEGVLTRKLLQNGWRVHALEKDSRSVQGLRTTLATEFGEKLEITETDILEWDPSRAAPCSVCIGNLPYYITSDILLWYAHYSVNYAGSVFMVQKEVADRIPAPPATKDYGRLSVRLQLMFHCRRLFVVPAAAFFPPPKVDSAVIVMQPTGFRFSSSVEDRAFDRFTATLFSARRKMLRRALASTLESFSRGRPQVEESFWTEAKKHAVFPETRPDAIPPQAIFALHNLLMQMRI